MADQVTIPALQQMKREGKKSVGVVAWDYQIARIADRAGVDFVSVGDSVGVNLWGHANPLEVTLEEMLVCCKAVRRGVTRALVSCDVPFGPVQEGVDAANEHLARVEQIKKFTIVPGDWLPGGDELTPTMKLKRKPIAEKYSGEIEAMYAK